MHKGKSTKIVKNDDWNNNLFFMEMFYLQN